MTESQFRPHTIEQLRLRAADCRKKSFDDADRGNYLHMQAEIVDCANIRLMFII